MAGVYLKEAKIRSFLGALLLSGLGLGLYKGIQDNYLAELVHISEFERGVVEFFRELPGLLVIVMIAALHSFSDSRVFKLGTAGMALGMLGMLGVGTGKVLVVACMFLFSTGEHLIMPVRTSLSLTLARPEKGGASLGITSALGFVGNIAGYILVALLFLVFGRFGIPRTAELPFKAIFAASALVYLGAAAVALTIPETAGKVKRRSWYFAPQFHKYYMLEVFYGARKQIFLTFAPYVLILHYGASASVISLLMALCAVCGVVFGPLTGKIIDRLGYKVVMVADTLILVVVCLMYGFAHRLFPFPVAFVVVCTNYVLDSIISLASMASNVYVRDIAATPEEVTATLSTGVSVNHLISIAIALMGGWIWKVTGIEVLFALSAVLGILNSIYAATIKPAHQEKSPHAH
jgi:MFS family permease